MDHSRLSKAIVLSIAASVENIAEKYFKVLNYPLRDGIAYGFAMVSLAKLLDRLEKGILVYIGSFSSLLFRAKLATEKHWREADALAAIYHGITVDIDIVKASPDRQRHAVYLDDLYDVSVRVQGAPAHIVNREVLFLIPEFRQATGEEGSKLVDGYMHRFESKDRAMSVTRDRAGREVMLTRLIGGEWRGGFSIRGTAQRANPEDAIRSLRAALARRVLAAVCPEVRILAYQPDSYAEIVWHLEVEVDKARELNAENLRFVQVLPEMANWVWRQDRNYPLDRSVPDELAVEAKNGKFEILLQWRGKEVLAEREFEKELALAKAELLRAIDLYVKRLTL